MLAGAQGPARGCAACRAAARERVVQPPRGTCCPLCSTHPHALPCQGACSAKRGAGKTSQV
eukprot:1148221-Pelagomonas_calceolata.AAC.3